MSSVAVQSGVPFSIDSGETVRFLVSDADYSALLWTAAFVLNNGVDAPVSTPGVPNGTGFDIVLTAAVTAALKPVQYQWALVYTAISPVTEKAIGETGAIEVLPNPSVQATPTFAQAQVTLLETVIASFGGNAFTSVSFNGQSFSRDNLTTYRSDLIFWQARVIAEQRRLNALRGTDQGGHIPIVFVPGLPDERCYPPSSW